MSRCRETSGILFQKACRAAAELACAQCQRPICRAHARSVATREVCVACARTALRDPGWRQSLVHLRDDPYFYWYYHPGYGDPYGPADYRLFDEQGRFGAGVDDPWQGT
ncbi:MAG: hypothetical protein IT373_25730 [Polyangiaceae bacterium]|nr:hypothetical protein [Polyangiaceae bacterium]